MDRIKDNVQQNESILQNFQEQSQHLKYSKYAQAKEDAAKMASLEKQGVVTEKKGKKPAKGKKGKNK